jgi:hypothetical protein
MAERDRDSDGSTDPKPADGIDGNPVPIPPPRFLQITSLVLGLVAVGAGATGKEGLLFIFCGLSVLFNAASLLFEGARVTTAQRGRTRQR